MKIRLILDMMTFDLSKQSKQLILGTLNPIIYTLFDDSKSCWYIDRCRRSSGLVRKSSDGC